MEFDDILICPKTKNRITIDTVNNIAKVEQSDIVYPIKAGIIDFLPDTTDRVSEAYDSVASSYDDYVNSSSLKWKLFSLIMWGGGDDDHYTQIEKVLSSIPEGFDGVLLDVPVGTGIFTSDKYRKLKKTGIIALDYSLAMLQKAQHLYAANGIKNVTFIRGDVGNLPIAQASVDLCLSMAGFHAFADKDRALSEIVRVLKTNRIFAGAFYIKGKRYLTDILVKYVLSRLGYLTAPFYDETETLSIFGEYFNTKYKANIKSIFYFEMDKK
ncbi:MAG: methyltransferase domain-containing protein [Planctomycetota bacterium]|jgi:ubiquinone/menaquinone biosynthesis C-methylase UbiE